MHATHLIPVQNTPTVYVVFKTRSVKISGGVLVVLDGPPNAYAICGDGPQCLWPISAEETAKALKPFMDQLSDGEKAELEHALHPPARVEVLIRDECYS